MKEGKRLSAGAGDFLCRFKSLPLIYPGEAFVVRNVANRVPPFEFEYHVTSSCFARLHPYAFLIVFEPKPHHSLIMLSNKYLLIMLNLGNKKDSAFQWNERYKVAVGVAEALVYLHNSYDPTVIYRDVKSSNILLSDDFEPQLSDFGLMLWASTTSVQITYTDVAGTFGFVTSVLVLCSYCSRTTIICFLAGS
ncbi:hypothetical protein M8C21_021307 [Ambrosia artemisiifolia]|uniref:Protein kinase domain-containing protein n=1 Tax=Ambrosia artemisiifolia TaxID=4212 RepID=A0AAD5CZL6_AMBAR|nr:hypothetical protein M8C21_021307 [Ambrosia artemisiifolia]